MDNMSQMPVWLSDAVCQLATGGGYAKRKHYTDAEEKIIDAQRPIILNGIADIATRADLLDRAVRLHLPRIQPTQRRTESEFWAAFEEARPRILGALLTAVTTALRRWPRVNLPNLPRMADFAKWVVAACPALGFSHETFLQAYQDNRTEADWLALDASPVASALLEFVQRDADAREPRLGWVGAHSDLLSHLSAIVPVQERMGNWPSNAQALSSALRRVATNLCTVGIAIEFDQPLPGTTSRRGIRITVLPQFSRNASSRRRAS